jgi:hypothetical protein
MLHDGRHALWARLPHRFRENRPIGELLAGQPVSRWCVFRFAKRATRFLIWLNCPSWCHLGKWARLQPVKILRAEHQIVLRWRLLCRHRRLLGKLRRNCREVSARGVPTHVLEPRSAVGRPVSCSGRVVGELRLGYRVAAPASVGAAWESS